MTNKEMRTKMRAAAAECDALADEAADLFDKQAEGWRIAASVACVQSAIKMEQAAKRLREGARTL